MKTFKIIRGILFIGLIILFTSQSVWHPLDTGERARYYTRQFEFDYFYWTIQSLWKKGEQASLGLQNYLRPIQQRHIVDDMLNLLNQLDSLDDQIFQIYTNPEVKNPKVESESLLAQKQTLEAIFDQQGPLAEVVIQYQISTILSVKGINFAGQTMPPVLFKMTSLPDQLILSPRSEIREDASISLSPGLTAHQMDDLEDKVSNGLNVSALIVPLGGVGVYPTMVYRESSIEYLLKVVAHEWVHNYLTLRPLGWHYEKNQQLRSMNETTADICGTEISQAVLRYFYPDKVSPMPYSQEEIFAVKSSVNQDQKPMPFDFNKEMHATRVQVDSLLSQGKVEEAEQFMELKRELFWENGYQIRKLNQAYFAFYGAYAESPLGAAGNDPVGPAVRLLREKSNNMADFLNRIGAMTSFEVLIQNISSY
jgi:hypothetical protein